MLEIDIFTEEEASDMFLKGNSSAYNSNCIIINKVNKGNNRFKGVYFTFNNKGYFLKYSNQMVFGYKDISVNKDENFYPCNDDIANYSNKLLMIEIIKKAGIFKFEDIYK